MEVFETDLYVAEITELGCTSRDSIFVSFENCEECLLFPNVFSPSGDGRNDVFQPVRNCEIEIVSFELEVYNRWGTNVFQSTDIQFGWDGTFDNDPSITEVYAWKSTYSFNQGSRVVEKCLMGNITLIR